MIGPWVLIAALAVGVFVMALAALVVVADAVYQRRARRRRRRRGGMVFGERPAGEFPRGAP